jgi:ribosomal protein L37E
MLSDGLGRHRRERRLPRAQRSMRCIVVLGHTGHISLEAVRWCVESRHDLAADQRRQDRAVHRNPARHRRSTHPAPRPPQPTTRSAYRSRTGERRLLHPGPTTSPSGCRTPPAPWHPSRRRSRTQLPAAAPAAIELRTPLTRAKARAAQVSQCGASRQPARTPAPMPTCRSCGATLFERRRKLCSSCWTVTRKTLAEQRAAVGLAALNRARAEGADPAQTVAAQERRRQSLLATKAAEAGWRSHPSVSLVSEEDFHVQVLPRLQGKTIRELQHATGLSSSACSRIRSRDLEPHPRHWSSLAALVLQDEVHPGR